jgi:predicted transglutaminase-like cysteine proteinase
MLLTKPLYLTRVILVTLTLVVLYPFILFADLTLSSQTLDSIEKNYNHHARERVVKWQALLNQPVDDLSDNEKLELVNTFFNSTVQFINDSALWNQEDYWATPLEFLSIGAGDCEDYAIAKYFTLKELGVDESKLRLTYVKAVEIGQAHMVLTYFETKRSIPLVLDNLIIEIKPANQRRDLVPVYSFNGDGLWLAKSRGEGQRVGNASRLSLWEDLNLRMLNANH